MMRRAEADADVEVVTTKAPLRILVVDDDKVDRLNVRRGLRAAGFDVEVDESDSYADATARIASVPYDAVFLDYFLPDGTGLAFLQHARGSGIRYPFIVLTGQGDEQTAVEIMKAGATDYVPKAHATPERLAGCLRSALRVHAAEKQAMLAEQERARALVLERLARDAAEAAQRRLAFLAEASAMASASLDYETTLENVARLAVPTLADWCFVDLLQPDGSFERVAVSHQDPEKASLAKRLRRRYDPMPDAPHGISRVMATGRSEVMTHTPDWVLVALARDAEDLEAMRELAPCSLMTVPLIARGRTLGAITFISSVESRYTQPDLEVAEALAYRAALAVDNARLFSDAKQAEERLRHQLDFTTAITSSLAEGVCALDREGRIVFANPAAEQILRAPTGSLRGRAFDDIVHEHGKDVRCPLIAAVLEGSILRVDEDTFAANDGGRVPVSYVVGPIVSGGVVTGCVLAFHDATARRRAEAELEASRRQLAQSEKLSALGTLVSGVAHELRTPLTYLTNNLFLLQARMEAAAREDPRVAPLVADTQRFSQAMLDGVDRINALVKDLRPFANTEARRVPSGLHDVVAGAVALFTATQRGRVEVVSDLQPTPPLALDRGQLQRVVINLLVNAADAMPRGGRVRVSTRAVGDDVFLEVEDEGMGIPPEVEARIFDPFFTTKADGTGLGLAITRRIVEAHGGEVGYRTKVGRGTTFTVRLPLRDAPSAALAAATTTP